MLRDIKAYIRTHQQVSAQQVADHFDVDLETVFFWMDYLIREGHIQKLEAPLCTLGECGGCAASGPGATLYRWLPRPFRPISVPVSSR